MDAIWQDLMTVGVPVAEKVARTIAVYAFLVVGLRLFGKRELGQLNPLDFIVLLLLSNTVQNAIIGNDNSLTGGLLGAAVLFVINDLLVRWSYRRPRVRRMIEGRAEVLIQDGRLLKHALERNFITREELVAAARKQGIDHLHTIESARLEVSGALSFTMREPSATEAFRDEVLTRLASIERRLGSAATALLLVAVAAHGLQAQARPSTDVWVVPMHQTGGEVHFGEPRNASKRTGYDNQPGFTPDGRAVLYTVIGDDGQADIWRYPLSGGRPRRITVTRESEYSATATPDGRGFSVIRVEADSTQRLWRFPLSGFGAPSPVLERIKPVGYHVWVGDHALVLFVLGRPATLQLADDRTGNAEVIVGDIGRALGKVPGRAAATFVQTVKDSGQWISELDVLTKSIRRIAQPPKGADFHAWTPQGTLLTGAGSVISAWADGRWQPIADFSRFGVRGISRMSVSPKGDWLAFVADDVP